MPSRPIDLPKGTLGRSSSAPCLLNHSHGWVVSERIQQVSSDVFRAQQDLLCPALHRLERRGGIKTRWSTSENNRKARFLRDHPARRALSTNPSDPLRRE